LGKSFQGNFFLAFKGGPFFAPTWFVVQYKSTKGNFMFFLFSNGNWELGIRIHGLFINKYLLRLITTIVHMPFYINFAQDMISINLGLKKDVKIIT
jgi:hypothetical protein